MRRTVPLFMVGVATAVAAEMALGILLYTSPGLLRALTLVLGIELAALTAGVATAPPPGRRGGRWRWFVGVGTVFAAGVLSILWSFGGDTGTSWWARGTSLAIFAALPLYGCGLLFSAVPRGLGRGGNAVPALMGAAVGVSLVGTVLVGRLQPFGVYLFAVFCIAVAAFVTGSSEDEATGREEATERGEDPAPPAPLVVRRAVALPGEEIPTVRVLAPDGRP